MSQILQSGVSSFEYNLFVAEFSHIDVWFSGDHRGEQC
jgi:hypothetical protein